MAEQADHIRELEKKIKQLEIAESRLQDVQKLAGIGYWSWDVKTGNVEWSDEVYKIFKLDPDQFNPQINSILELSPWAQDNKRNEELIARAIKSKEKGTYDQKFLFPDGTIGYYHSTFQGRYDEQGELIEIDGTVMDVTEQKRMQTRIRQIEKMDAIGKLAGGIAHDFNNQLAIIMGCAGFLNKQLGDNAKLQRYVNSIITTARRSADLTRQLLTFSRQGEFQEDIIDVHHIIHEVVSLVEHTFDKRIGIEALLDADTAKILGDASQIQNALLNLAINARDAMSEGGELIFKTAIRPLNQEYCQTIPYIIEPGNYLLVTVTDSGRGIHKTALEHIFEPFYTTKEVGQGTGMGLAVVYGTVKQHKGAINVYSEVGHGTTFSLYFPLLDNMRPKKRKTKQNIASISSAKILVVEDEESLREIACEILTARGHQVTSRENGLKAMEYYKDHWQEVDLVILDMVMPKMDGQTTYRAMREINPNVKVLLASGYSINGLAKTLLEEGVLDFLQKPFLPEEIEEKIAKILSPKD